MTIYEKKKVCWKERRKYEHRTNDVHFGCCYIVPPRCDGSLLPQQTLPSRVAQSSNLCCGFWRRRSRNGRVHIFYFARLVRRQPLAIAGRRRNGMRNMPTIATVFAVVLVIFLAVCAFLPSFGGNEDDDQNRRE